MEMKKVDLQDLMFFYLEEAETRSGDLRTRYGRDDFNWASYANFLFIYLSISFFKKKKDS